MPMSDTCNWDDVQFNIYDPAVDWNDCPGVYIFTYKDHASGIWIAVYIGETGSFRNRIPGHDRWADARRKGATHIHARVVEGHQERIDLEHRLIGRFGPPLNFQHR